MHRIVYLCVVFTLNCVLNIFLPRFHFVVRSLARSPFPSRSLGWLIAEVICYGIVVIGFYYGYGPKMQAIPTIHKCICWHLFPISTYFSAFAKRYPIHIISNNFIHSSWAKPQFVRIQIGSPIKCQRFFYGLVQNMGQRRSIRLIKRENQRTDWTRKIHTGSYICAWTTLT